MRVYLERDTWPLARGCTSGAQKQLKGDALVHSWMEIANVKTVLEQLARRRGRSEGSGGGCLGFEGRVREVRGCG
jgi:hypothetical protein